MPVDLQSYSTKNLDPYKLLVDLRKIVTLVNKLEIDQRQTGDQLSTVVRAIETAAADQGGSIAPGPPAIGPFTPVYVDPAGAILGDGSAIDPLRVSVDGVTVTIVGNQLTVIAGGSVIVDPAGALDGDGTAPDPLAVRVDNTTIIINGSNQLEAVGGGGGTYCEPLTDGDPTQPELIFAGGDVIMACYP